MIKRSQLKHPKLFRFLILIIGTFALAGSELTAGFSMVLLFHAALLLVHYHWPSRLGWWLIIGCMVLPVLLVTGLIWRTSGYPVSFGDYSGFSVLFASFLITMVAMVLLIFYAAQVNNAMV